MKLINISFNFILILAFSLLISCSGTEANMEENTEESPYIQISAAQFQSENMLVGSAEMQKFNEKFQTNGTLVASPQSIADVYSFVPGVIKSISVQLNSHVKKGQMLCSIESKDFISIQQNYLESKAQLHAVESNYNRIKSLFEENISSQKDYLEAESQYKILTAQIEALKAELSILNVNMEELNSGKLSAYLPIYSPIDGYVNFQNCNIGLYVDSQKLLMKITDNSHLQLHFFVYQDDIKKLFVGQEIVLELGSEKYSTKISSISKYINPDNKSLTCIAELDEKTSEIFTAGMHTPVEVILENRMALALPHDAILKENGKYYVLYEEKIENGIHYFKRMEIEIGLSSKSHFQIISNHNLNKVLLKGAYYFHVD